MHHSTLLPLNNDIKVENHDTRVDPTPRLKGELVRSTSMIYMT